MTGPSPDADTDAALDEALGITQLPPATITDAHDARAGDAIGQTRASVVLNDTDYEELRRYVARALADEAQRAVARYIAERQAAGTAGGAAVTLARVRALVEETWPESDQLHPALRRYSIRNRFLAVLDGAPPRAG